MKALDAVMLLLAVLLAIIFALGPYGPLATAQGTPQYKVAHAQISYYPFNANNVERNLNSMANDGWVLSQIAFDPRGIGEVILVYRRP